jgi:hypothetical protein
MMNVTMPAPIDLAGAILGIELMVFQGLPAFPCCDSSRSPCSTASLCLSVWARSHLPRPPSSRRGGAVDTGGRAGSSGNKREIAEALGRRQGCSGLGRWVNIIVDPPYDSPASLGGVLNSLSSILSSGVTTRLFRASTSRAFSSRAVISALISLRASDKPCVFFFGYCRAETTLGRLISKA